MASAPIHVRQVDHVTLVVRSLDSSREFYVNLLGMEEVPRPAFRFPGAWFRAGSTLIHLIEQHEQSGPAGWSGIRSSRNHHMAFDVEDARVAAEVLRNQGIVLIDGPKLRPDGAVQLFLADPDGHIVELCSTAADHPATHGSGLPGSPRDHTE